VWARWAEVVLTPVVGVLLLGGTSLVLYFSLLSRGIGISPDLFNYIFTSPWKFIFQNQLPIGTEIQWYYLADSLLVLVMLAGELGRFAYLLVQRLRSARAPQSRVETASVTPAWVSVAGPAVAIGLWVAADALLLEGLLESYLFGVVNLSPLIPSLGQMFGQAAPFINQAPWLLLAPLLAILVLYTSLNLVGFGVRGVLLRSPEPEQH
jgi:hypothetical protein